MPPKKKQQQIDISTLPQCISNNCIFYCSGRKQRSQIIINKIFSQYKSIFSKISKQQILDHAKQKNIYIDPNTLNDKQKKDAKFMESINTELTPDVIAKAVKSYIEAQNVKVRMELKLQGEKPQSERVKPVFEKKLDQVYCFQDFPQTKQEFQALAKINQNIKYVLVINPSISWSNAPQIPQPQQNQQQQPLQQQQQDQQLKQLKLLQQKQTISSSDLAHIKQINTHINQIRNFRTSSSRDSIFRDCIIQEINCQIDPYNQEKSIVDVVKMFIQRIQKLNVQYEDYVGWKKDKVQEDIFEDIQQVKKQKQKVEGENQQNKQQVKENVEKIKIQVKGANINQILSNFVDDLFGNIQKQTNQQDDLEDLINSYNFEVSASANKLSQNKNNINNHHNNNQNNQMKSRQFYCNNQTIYQSQSSASAQYKIRSSLQYPGINRYLMPDIALKSSSLRKFHRSQFIHFLSQNLPYEQFERRLSLHYFSQIIKQLDQDRHYNFNNRVYEQHHNEQSLTRELYRLMAMNQGHFLTKYNEENDKLYLLTLYKNNQRRGHFKKWEANWRVLPNYQSWLKYFKDNQSNFNSQSFYNIDYEKIGHINDQVYAFSCPDGGIVIKKQCKIAGKQNQFLYAIKNHHLFGINNDVFFSDNKGVKLYHYKVKSNNNNQSNQNNAEEQNNYESIIQLNENMRLRLKQSGDVIVQSKHNSTRMYTPDGYTVIYQPSQSTSPSTSLNYKILHPSGGITLSDKSYINQKGFGIKNNQINQIPTLLRRTQQFQIIKRDDNTITVKQNNNNKKWIKFFEGTEYLIENNSILIEKQNMPFVKCNQNGIQIQINGILINGERNQQNQEYVFTVQHSDGNQLRIFRQKVSVTETLSNIPYIIDLNHRQFNIQFNNQKLLISKQKILYFNNNRQFNPLQSQQNFSQSQTLPSDHLHPRLFIINHDNTGIQLLNQQQLQHFFTLKSNPNNNVISTIPSTQHYQTIHIVSRIIPEQQMNKKRILPDFNINLDIFKSEKYVEKNNNVEKFAVRSFIRYKLLEKEDNQELNMIKQKHQSWLKFIRKQENQYGYKQKNDPSIEELQKQKNIMITFRKKQLEKVDFNKLKEQSIQQWKNRQKEQLDLIAQKQEEEKIRNRMKKPKKSVTEQYLPLVIKQKQLSDDNQNYTPAQFYSHYFQTSQGKRALSSMPQWVFRPKTAKNQPQLDPQIVSQLHNTMNKIQKQQSQQISQQQKQRYDTVQVNLNPTKQIIIKPSVFTQRQIDQQRLAFEEEKKAYFYHEKKRKDFDVYGTERGKKIEVKSLLRTQPISQINQKYLITEAPFDKKIKIASMKNKLTSQASSLVQMRKQGPHNTLLKTLDKRNDYNQLLQKRTMMVHADLNDKLQRDILITPVEVNFGYLKQGRTYQFRINVKNEDILAQRLVVKKPRQHISRVQMSQMGPIALGMSRKIIVQIKAASEYLGRYTDEFQIVSKHQIYRIPIIANILTESQFENQNVVLANGVKEIQEVMKRKTSELPPIN